MKSIKTYEGFFDWFNKESEDDKIVSDLIKRLKKVKGVSPYKIEFILKNANGSFSGTFKVTFDDITIELVKDVCDKEMYPGGWSDVVKERGWIFENKFIIYRLKIDIIDEYVLADWTSLEDLYEILEKVYKKDKESRRIEKIRNEMNPAADKLKD